MWWLKGQLSSRSTIYFGCNNNRLYAVLPTGFQKWFYDTGSTPVGDNIFSSPAIDAEGNIYFGCDNNKLYSIKDDGGSASLRWVFEDASGPISASPTIGLDATIYVGSEDNNFYAVTPGGNLKWSYETGDGIFSSAAIGDDGTIYFGSLDGYLYALNSDGTLKWRFYTSPLGISPSYTALIATLGSL